MKCNLKQLRDTKINSIGARVIHKQKTTTVSSVIYITALSILVSALDLNCYYSLLLADKDPCHARYKQQCV